MKFKIPSKIRVLNQDFKVVKRKNQGGGFFNISDNTIIIGVKHLQSDPEYVFEILCHEISEIIHCKLNTRFEGVGSEKDYLFAQDHKQFQNHTMILSGIIFSQLIK